MVTARNNVGESDFSDQVTILAAVKPDPPHSIVRDDALTTKTQIAFSWSYPLDDGSNTVTDYRIYIFYDALLDLAMSTQYSVTATN